MNLAAPKTILRIYVFVRRTIIEGSSAAPGDGGDVHFFLDIQINPPYKGDTSACSMSGAYFDVKGESHDEIRNQEESGPEEESCC
jgi:hypothetical protein